MSGGNDSREIANDWATEDGTDTVEWLRRIRVVTGDELPTFQDKEELMKRGCYLFTTEPKEEEWNQVDQMAYELLHSMLKATRGYNRSNNYVEVAYELADEFERVRKERNNPSQINFTEEN